MENQTSEFWIVWLFPLTWSPSCVYLVFFIVCLRPLLERVSCFLKGDVSCGVSPAHFFAIMSFSPVFFLTFFAVAVTIEMRTLQWVGLYWEMRLLSLNNNCLHSLDLGSKIQNRSFWSRIICWWVLCLFLSSGCLIWAVLVENSSRRLETIRYFLL